MTSKSAVCLVDTITQQLQEVDILSAMFPGEEELVWRDPSLLIDAKEFRDTEGHIIASELQCLAFELNITAPLNDGADEFPINISVKLPKEYPAFRPELSITSEKMSRNELTDVKSELNGFISTLEFNEQILLEIILWLKENVGYYYKGDTDAQRKSSSVKETNEELTEMWLYMHHIYSKHKRKDIRDWSSDYRLTGFCLPGKPGVVYIEGLTSNVEAFYERLRSLQWKSIKCRHREICVKRIFMDFQELSFDPQGARNYHMDFGLFYKFLTDNNLGHMFKELFGVEGK